MSKWLRRIRGAIGMGLTWAAAWLGAGLILLLIVGVGAADVPFPALFAVLGFLAGVAFSAVLGIVEGRRRFDQMSLPRFAAWGGVGGLLLSVVMTTAVGGDAFPVLALIFVLSGAGCAAGSLALARLADDRESLGPGPDTDAEGPTDEEARGLFGGGG